MSASGVRLVVIGGSDAGISAAVRAKEIDSATDVTVLLADEFPNYSVCGLPFYLSGEVDDWHRLAHRTTDQLHALGIRVLSRHLVSEIDATRHAVLAVADGGCERALGYDKLVIATGARARRPPGVSVTEPPGVFCLRTMGDCLAIEQYILDHKPRTALIVGAGYIGVEMADALTRRGTHVTLCGRGVLNTVDVAFGDLVRGELERHGVRVVAASAEGVASHGYGLNVSLSDGSSEDADMVVVATGVDPATELATEAGVVLGETGAIAVDRAMRTNTPDVFAAGDCVETWHRLLGRPVYLPLGSTAHKQGRAAGENALGGSVEYSGTLGTQVVKVFNLAVARTGMSDQEARAERYTPLTVESERADRTAYYPDVHNLRARLTGDTETGRLLGAQLLGDWRAQVAKRIDVLAAAIHCGMRVHDLDHLDLSYTPPLSTPWDPVQMAGHTWVSEFDRFSSSGRG